MTYKLKIYEVYQMNVRSTSNVNSSDLIQRRVAVSIPEYTPERDNLRNTTRVCFKTKKLLTRMCVCVHIHMWMCPYAHVVHTKHMFVYMCMSTCMCERLCM